MRRLTIKALLINVSEDQKNILDNMMTTFCSAIRYSFKKLLEGKKIGDLENEISHKYNLNIRQAKDAVENARQTIVSQKELVKINYTNYEKKIRAIEKLLEKENISKKKREALKSKLAKRQRRLKYFKDFIDNGSIPPVIFGTKAMFLRRCKNLITHDEWVNCRNNRIYSRGDKTKNGNPNLRVMIKDGVSFLEISTLEKNEANRAVKIQIPLYLPQKLSKKTSKVNGINYREIFYNHLQTKEAYQVEVLRKDGKYYCLITFNYPEIEHIYTVYEGIIGVVKLAKIYGTGLAIEDLKFKDDKDVSSKFSRVKHGFIYSTLLSMLENACYRQGIGIIKVNLNLQAK